MVVKSSAHVYLWQKKGHSKRSALDITAFLSQHTKTSDSYSLSVLIRDTMEEPHIYEMVGIPSYTTTDNPSYATTDCLQVKASTSANKKSHSAVDKRASRVNKFAVLAVIALLFIAMLASSGIAVALLTYFNTGASASDVQAQITQLTQDFDITKVRQNNQLQKTIVADMNVQAQVSELAQVTQVTQDQLTETMMKINATRDIPGKPRQFNFCALMTAHFRTTRTQGPEGRYWIQGGSRFTRTEWKYWADRSARTKRTLWATREQGNERI